MFVKGKQCLICDAPWHEDSVRCRECGSIAEITFERPLPDADTVDEEKIQQCIDRARAHLTEHENDGLAHYTLAMAYVNLGLLPEGAGELDRAAQLLPEKTEIAYEAAAMAVKDEVFSDDVLRKIDRILARRPNFKEAIYLKGFVLQKRGKTKEAVRVWQDAYELDPDYVPVRKALEKFIGFNDGLLKNPRIVRSLRQTSLTKKERAYLDLVNWTGMDRPRELGATSMQLLEAISPAKAKKMRQMHAARVQQYEEVEQKRNELAGAMEADVVALSDLCLRAQEARSRIGQAARGSRSVATTAAGGRRLSIEERSAILEREIQRYQKQGYRLVSQTKTTAQLSKRHEFSCCLALILVLLVVGIIIYLIYYLTAKKEYYLFLEVDEYGNVNRSRS